MLVLMASGARPRSREDIVRALALPEGARFRLRYDRAMVDDVVADEIAAEQLGGKTGLVSYVDTRSRGAPTIVVPCRCCAVKEARFVGSSCLLELTAAGYAARTDDSEFRSMLSPTEREAIPNWKQSVGGPHLAGKFVFETGTTFGESVEKFESFEEIAARLREHDDFAEGEGDLFFVIQSIRPSARTADRPRESIPPLDGTYHLRSGERYEVDVYCYAPARSARARSTAAQLVVDSNCDEVAFPLGKIRRVDSEYDLKTFVFSVGSRTETLSTALRVSIRASENLSPQCDITLPLSFERVRFGGSPAIVMLRILLISVGTASPALIAALNQAKLSFWAGVAMLATAAVAAFAVVFPKLRLM